MHRLTRASSCPRGIRGATLAELVCVLALIVVITGFALPPFHRALDRIATRGAARETMMAFFTARAEAISRGQRTVVLLDDRGARVVVVGGGETLLVRPVGATHGIRMTTTRDSMTFFPDGLGLGAANLSVLFSRGAAVDTVIVSREGRVKLGTRAR